MQKAQIFGRELTRLNFAIGTGIDLATRRELALAAGHGDLRNCDLARERDARMKSLADDIKGKCATEGVNDSLVSDSAHWRSLYLRLRESAHHPDPLAVGALSNPAILSDT